LTNSTQYYQHLGFGLIEEEYTMGKLFNFNVYLLTIEVELLPSPHLPPFVSTSFACATAQTFGRKLYKQLQVLKVVWKVIN